jgi:hypothetical protein
MQALANVIIRPDRDQYTEEELGPSMFLLQSVLYHRQDFEVSFTIDH